MAKDLFAEWAKSFRSDAEKDQYSVFRDHMLRLGLPDKPELMLAGTLQMVAMCSAFCTLDGRQKDFKEFLQLQTYDPSLSKKANFAYTFDIVRLTYARVLVATTKSPLDLADLYGVPWHEYEVCGFSGLWISHPDWSPIKKSELRALEKEIMDDIYFDYAKDEVDVWCDVDSSKEFVRVYIQDRSDEEDLEWEQS